MINHCAQRDAQLFYGPNVCPVELCRTFLHYCKPKVNVVYVAVHHYDILLFKLLCQCLNNNNSFLCAGSYSLLWSLISLVWHQLVHIIGGFALGITPCTKGVSLSTPGNISSVHSSYTSHFLLGCILLVQFVTLGWHLQPFKCWCSSLQD